MRFNVFVALKNVFFISVVLILLQLIISIGEGPVPLLIVSGKSMEKTLYEGDIILWHPTEISEIREGDIIVFRGVGGNYIVHRVFSKIVINGEEGLLTKGDSNEYLDQERGEVVVTDANLVGKVLMVDRSPFKIPYIGVIGLKFDEAKKMLVKVIWGRHTKIEDAIVYFILGVVIISGSQIFKRERDGIKSLYVGRKNIRVRRVFVLFFSIMLIISSVPIILFPIELEVAVGVNEIIDNNNFLNFSNISRNSTSKSSYYIYNPCLLPIRTIVFVTSNISSMVSVDRTYILASGSGYEKEVVVRVPPDASEGTYKGKICVYSSFFWVLFPDVFIEVLESIGLEQYAFLIVLNIFSSLLFSIVFTMGLVLIDRLILLWKYSVYEARFASVLGSKIYGYLSFYYGRLRKLLLRVFSIPYAWFTIENEKYIRAMNVFPFAVGGAVFTFVCILDGLILPIVYGCAITTALVFIFLTRKRAEIYLGNVVFVAIPIIFFFIKAVLYTNSYILLFSVFSFLYFILAWMVIITGTIMIKLIVFVGKMLGLALYDY